MCQKIEGDIPASSSSGKPISISSSQNPLEGQKITMTSVAGDF